MYHEGATAQAALVDQPGVDGMVSAWSASPKIVGACDKLKVGSVTVLVWIVFPFRSLMSTVRVALLNVNGGVVPGQVPGFGEADEP